MQPVFIVGYPRSGTTLLLHFLMSSNQFPHYEFDESHFFSHFYLAYGNLSNERNAKTFLSHIIESQWIKGSGLEPQVINNYFDGVQFSYADVFRFVMDTIAARQGFSRWIEKTPWHMLYVRDIKKAMPNAKFVFVVRDPRDVVLSVDGYGWNHGAFKSVLRNAESWKWHVKRALRDLTACKADFIIIKYEDLLQNSEESAKKLGNFLGVELNIDEIRLSSRGVLKKPNSSNAGASAKKIAKHAERWDDIDEVNYVLAESMTLFGYQCSHLSPRWSRKLIIYIISISYRLAKNARQTMFPLVRK